MKMIHRQKRPQQRGGGQQNEQEQERIRQVLTRMQSALQLGLRSNPGGKKWSNSDGEVQVQAARAIFALVGALSSRTGRPALPQGAVEDCVAALEGLLGAEREAVYSKAADAAAGLVAVLGDGLLGFGSARLVKPLAHLLNCSKSSTANSAATALHGIFVKVKPRNSGSDDSMWKTLEEMDTLGIIVRKIQLDTGSSEKDAAFMDLLDIILERWPGSRYRLGCVESFLATLQLRCRSNNVGVAQGALRCLTASALCGCTGGLELRDAGNFWATISSSLNPSNPLVVQLEALRLLTTLCKIPTFGALFTGPHIEGIAAGCSQALEQASSGERRWSSENEMLIVEAAHATSSVLSWPGLHHMVFLRHGIADSIFSAVEGVHSKGGGKGKLNPRLRPLLWEVVGWLGAHFRAEWEYSSPETSAQSCLFSRLPAFACASMLKALCRRGHNPAGFDSQETELAKGDSKGKLKEELPVNTLEVVQICKAVLLLLSSQSCAIASHTKLCLEDALVFHGIDWLPSVLKTLALAGSSTIKIDHVQTMTNLLAIACISWLDQFQEEFMRLQALKVVLEIMKAHAADDMDQIKTERLSAMHGMVHSFGAKACCIEEESWEGHDSVLFSALWALFRLLQGSDWAREVRGSITEHMLDNSTWGDIKEGDILLLLLKVAGDNSKAAGVRWLAVCCLSCFGVYGFPSIVGKDMKKAVGDPTLADVTFLLSDGSRLCAHGVVLAARCESLLPVDLQTKVNGSSVKSDMNFSQQDASRMPESSVFSREENGKQGSAIKSDPAVVHLSSRLTHGSLRTLLEFVYTGIVYIPLHHVTQMKILAKRCRIEPLASLLQGKSPGWGQPPAPCDLSFALGYKGHPMSNILLRSEKPQTDGPAERICQACPMVADHVHAHRLVLSARCEYFEALFRSGMRDSAQEEVQYSVSRDTLVKLVHYLYSAELKDAVVDCSWTSLGMKSQLGLLQSLVDLAELAGQLVLEELQQLTWLLIGAYLDQNVHLCPFILSLAAYKLQWPLVDLCAACLAPAYPQLRDSGALDSLPEELTDLARAAHVTLSMTKGLLTLIVSRQF